VVLRWVHICRTWWDVLLVLIVTAWRESCECDRYFSLFLLIDLLQFTALSSFPAYVEKSWRKTALSTPSFRPFLHVRIFPYPALYIFSYLGQATFSARTQNVRLLLKAHSQHETNAVSFLACQTVQETVYLLRPTGFQSVYVPLTPHLIEQIVVWSIFSVVFVS